MFFSLLVTAREGLEMALIIAILLGYLRSVGQKQHFREIWYGVGAAAALSIAFGGGLEIASRELDGRVLEAFEGFHDACRRRRSHVDALLDEETVCRHVGRPQESG